MYQLLSLLLISSVSLEDFYKEPLPFSNSYFWEQEVIYESDPFIRWEILREGYEYQVRICNEYTNEKQTFPYTQENFQEIHLETGYYSWGLRYRYIGTLAERTILLNLFNYEADDPLDKTEENTEVEDEIEVEEKINDIQEEKEDDYFDEEIIIEEKNLTEENTEIKEENITTDSFDNNDEETEDSSKKSENQVLGVNKEISQPEKQITSPKECSVVYDKRSKKYSIKNCSFEFPNISEVSKYEIDDEYDYLIVKGEIPEEVAVFVNIVDCRSFSLFEPSTWFKCQEEISQKVFKLNLLYSPKISIQGKKSVISAYDIEDGHFLLKIFSEKLENEKISLSFDIYFYFHIDDIWIEFKDHIQKNLSYTKKKKESEKPLEYVFEDIIGVTQWHGYTAYDSPHTGIDFGSVKEDILSPEDGVIVSAGWDSYYGECNSGGNYVKIKHTNGLYTVYFHLDDYVNKKGHEWKAGEKIKEGQKIGTSGNTGAYNCQRLGYHLHYEVRKTPSQSSHTDPVPLTNIDWALVPTINWNTHPGRLTGDNPHPNF